MASIMQRKAIIRLLRCSNLASAAVDFFLGHTLPGYDVGDIEEVCIAHVHWYDHVPAGRDDIHPKIGCPVFKERFKDDISRNMLPLEKLAPVSLTTACDRDKRGYVNILNNIFQFFRSCTLTCRSSKQSQLPR